MAQDNRIHWVAGFRDTFLAGLVLLIPAFVTVWIISILLHLLNSLLPLPVEFPGLRIIITLFVIFLVGLLAKNIVGKRLFKYFETILLKIPLVNNIYNSSKEVVKTFSQSANPAAFKRVVLVEYPRKGMYSIGFITKESNSWCDVPGTQGVNLVAVFFPTTPNPATGYVTLVPKSDIIPVDISLEEGIKIAISGGIITPDNIPPQRDLMKLNYKNMFNTPNTAIQISSKELTDYAAKVGNIIRQLNRGEGDNQDKGIPMLGWQDYAVKITKEEIAKITAAAGNLAKKSDVVFVIGIGGSYLGPRAVIEAVYGKNYNDVLPTKIYFIGCDTDPDFYSHCLKVAAGKRVGAIVISKSGTTTEPALAFRFIKELITKQHGAKAGEQIIAVTDAKKGALRKMAEQEGYQTFVIPDDIGGRFSVITPVGLVPIALSGINIGEYIEGFRQIKSGIDNPDLEKNIAAQYALLRYLSWKKGAVVEYQVTNSSFFEANIFWTMQLEPESEGHQGNGLHVVPAVFPRDLHSIGQLIQQGPRNLIEIATKIMNAHHDLKIPSSKENLDDLNYITDNKLTLNDINKMTIDGPLAAHFADGVPNMTIELEKITPQNLGEYHYMLMKATAIQGYLLGHNPFVQPGVQFWKDRLFAMAGKPGY